MKQTKRNNKMTRFGVAWSVALFCTLVLGVGVVFAAIDSNSFAGKADFTSSPGPTGVVSGDVDGDGKSDLVVANYGSNGTIGTTVSVFTNTTSVPTNITFAAKVDFTTGNGPHELAIGDVNGDGKLDIVTTNYDANGNGKTITVLRNTSSAGTLSFVRSDFSTGVDSNGPMGVAIGDVNGDSKPDIVVSDFWNPWGGQYGTTVQVFLNNLATFPDATAVSFAAFQNFSLVGSASPYGIAICEIDGGNLPDLVVTEENQAQVTVLRNTTTSGSMTASFATPVSFTVDVGPRNVGCADLDGDGKLDMVVTNFGARGSQNGTTTTVFRNTSTPGTVSFDTAGKVTLTSDTGALGLVIDYLDLDSKRDIAVGNFTADNISVFRNASTVGVLSFETAVNFGAGDAPHGLASKNINGDNKVDLIVANYGNGTAASTISVLRNTNAGPTAVTLSAFDAQSQGKDLAMPGLFAIVGLTMLAGGAWYWRRKNRARA